MKNTGRKPKDEHRDFFLRIRLSNEERKRLWKTAQDKGFSTVSTYVRNIILDREKELSPIPNNGERLNLIDRNAVNASVREIRKIGVNVNQIAKKANSLPEASYALERDVRNVITMLQDCFEKVSEIEKIINNREKTE